MKGLELSELYYKEYGAPMIAEKFPEIEAKIAAGLCGEGSECLGFDDETSRDHDFEPSFCLWLTSGDFEKYSFALSREYSKLPSEFMGFRRSSASPTGGARRGVFKISDFYERFIGSASYPGSFAHWLSIPEASLACAVSGKVFRDDLGEFSALREQIKKGYPRDIRLKKLAASLILAHQSGAYNYPRCLAHGESGAAQLAIYTYVKNIMSSIFLINNAYMPFYKWSYRAMKKLERLSDLGDTLTFLTETGNGAKEANVKSEIIADVSALLLKELRSEGTVSIQTVSLEAAAYEVNGKISDPTLRNESIFAGMMRE